MSLPDVVYVVRPGDENPELRYSLRALTANVPHGRVFIAGHIPRWLKDVVPVPVLQIGSKYNNSTTNLRAAAQRDDLSDDFLYFNDDFFVMTEHPDGIPVLNRGMVDDVEQYYVSRGQGNYLRGLRSTRTRLHQMGYPDPVSYELHVPMLLNKDQLLAVLDEADDVPGLHKRTLYGNVWELGGDTVPDCKVLERGNTFSRRTPYLSTLPSSFRSGAVGQFIRSRFPDPCHYEGQLSF